jgi:DNA modification methylase
VGRRPDIDEDAPRLHWPGKDAAPASEMQAAPLVAVEWVGGEPGDDGGLLVEGDNLDAARALLPKFAGKVDLVYLDPPFATGDEFTFTARGEADERVAYRDRHDGIAGYLSAMLARLRAARALLAPTGSIFLHCDWHASHWLRCLLDEVFGAAAFKNEIIWRYRRWPAKTRAFQKMHDVIFWYARSPDEEQAWTPMFEPLAASTVETWGDKKQVADFSTGRRRPSQTDEPTPGAPMSDVWEIGIVAPIAKERVGYPTQKPLALLERIVAAASRPGDLVVDLFAGSGTTLVAAEKLGRRWIGCDAGALAIHTTKKRLLAARARPFTIARAGAPIAVASPAEAPPTIAASIEKDLFGKRTVVLDHVAFAKPPPAELRVRGRVRPGSWVDLVDYWSVGARAGAGPFVSARHAFRDTPQSELDVRLELPDDGPDALSLHLVDVFGARAECALDVKA